MNERKIIFEPRDDEELKDATLHKVPIHKYSDLARMAEKHGPQALLSHMFRQAKDHIILLQNPKNMNSGHWFSVSCRPKHKQIYFFSTYGKKPDIEKMEWMDEDDLRESGQLLNIFNEGMREMQKHGWEIHFNDHKYQDERDKTATCGIYTVAFIRGKDDPETFYKKTQEIREQLGGKDPALYYYKLYFDRH